MRPAALRATQRVLIGSDWFDVHWIWRHRLPTALARRAAEQDASADGHAHWPLQMDRQRLCAGAGLFHGLRAATRSPSRTAAGG